MKTRLLVAGLVLAVILVIAGSIYATGKTYYVPKDFATLQEAINAAKDGDTIVLAEGTYEGNIYFKGKSITLKSTEPDDPDVVAKTIIEGTDKGSTITVDSDATISGFTITSANSDCRGIYVKNASPTIENCTIIDNETTELGGGIYILKKKSKPQIINCVITGNIAGGTPQISESIIGGELADNTVDKDDNTINQEQLQPSIIDEGPFTDITPGSPAPIEKPQASSMPAAGSVPALAFPANILYAATNYPVTIYKYTEGDTWEKISPDTGLFSSDDELVSLLEHNGKIYAATNGYITDEYGWKIWIGKVWKYVPENEIKPWQPVFISNHRFGNGPWVDFGITAMAVYNDGLYVTTTTAVKQTPKGMKTVEGGCGELFVSWYGLPWQKVSGGDEFCIDALQEWDSKLYFGHKTGSERNGWGCYDGTTFEQNEGPAYGKICDFEVHNNTLFSSTITSSLVGNIYDLLDPYKYPPYYPNIWHAYSGGSDPSYTYPDVPPIPLKISLESCNGNLYYYVGYKLFRLSNREVFDTLEGNDITDPIWPSYPEFRPYDYGLITAMAASDDGILAFGTTGKETVDIPGEDSIPASAGSIYVMYDENNDQAQFLPAIETGTRKDIQVLLLLNKTDDIVWKVDDSAPAGGDGRTWANAFQYLQDALTNQNLQAGDEIWVGHGTYKPDQGNGIAPLDRNATFQLINGAIIKGGYAGLDYNELGASNPCVRDIAHYQTILSGDIDNDGTLNNNSYTVVRAPDDGNLDTVIDGFTITGGNNTYSQQYGGGITNRGCLLTVQNCILKDNHSNWLGGAIHNMLGLNLNEMKAINCFFINNSAGYAGGAVSNSFGAPAEIINCVFSANTANYGGAIEMSRIAPSLFKVTNCTFHGNFASYGGGIYTNRSTPIITNCIFRNNGESIRKDPFDDLVDLIPTVTYCDIEGGYPGTGNVDGDPVFADTELIAGEDGIFRTCDDGLRLQEGSPCIDKANDAEAPPTDILGRERVDVPGVVRDGGSPADMGAYEVQEYEHVDPQPVHFTGLIMAGECNEETKGWSKAFDPTDSCMDHSSSNLVDPGEYPSTSVAIPTACDYTLDGIAIHGGTRLIIYSQPNFQGEILLDKSGPAIINNMHWITDGLYNVVMTMDWPEPLQSEFPQSVREWSETYMHNNRTYPWHNGSFKIIKGY